MAVQTVADKLSAQLWQEMSVQSPENTIYSAGANKKKERSHIMKMDWGLTNTDNRKEREQKSLSKVYCSRAKLYNFFST